MEKEYLKKNRFMSKTHDNFFTKYDSLKNLGSFADLKND